MDGLSASELDDLLRRFLAEDVGPGDVTTDSIVPEDAVAAAEIVAKSECVVSGLPISRRVFELLDPDLEWEDRIATGATAPPATTLARLSGRARAILTGERVALNLLQRMCGIATATRRYVDAVSGTGCRILDTRKTAPGLRTFDRAAVRDGGGTNHRAGLYDMVLVKDNHRAIAGGLSGEGHNPLCGDRLTVYVRIEGGVIADASFQGFGCAIATASASLMSEAVKGRTRAEAAELFGAVHGMLTGGPVDSVRLGKLAALAGVRAFPARVKCASLAWHTLNAALAGGREPVTTE